MTTTAARHVAVNTGILYARMGVTVFISLYATRLILNALGAEDFGLFNVIAGAITMLTFMNTAMAASTQRFMSFALGEGNYEKQAGIFNVSFILHLLIAFFVVLILLAAGHLLIGRVLKIPPQSLMAARVIFILLIVSTFFTIISVPYDALLNAHENMLFIAVTGIVEAAGKLVIALYINSKQSDKLVIYAVLMVILSVIMLATRQVYCHLKYSESRIDPRKYLSRKLFREMTGFAGWSFLGISTGMLANYGQGIVLNVFFGTVVNAAQGIANQISGQLGALASTMLRALNPVIAKSEGAGNRSLMLKASLMGSKISFFLLLFVYIPVLLEMPFILKVWLGNVPGFTVIFCRLLLLRNLVDQLFLTLSASISAVGKIRKFQIYSSILNLVPLLASYILFRMQYPPYTIYVIFLLYSIFNSGLILHFSRINCDLNVGHFINEVLVRCVVSFVLILALSAIPLFFMNENAIRLIVISIISILSFLIVTVSFGFNGTERRSIANVIIETTGMTRLVPKILR